ncbi:MAG: hypothetical protein KJO69_05455 [Gammaproteobacteria bacterium]|nr:hypothetical protein [Gammaproteobacteria bacterium]MBT8449112.1 hypothetical protein [Gammaproteobacteria bacterium]
MAYIITTAALDYISVLDRHAATSKNEAVSVRSVAATTFQRNRLLNLRDLLDRLLSHIDILLALPAYMKDLIIAEIRERVNDPTYDVAAEFLSMQAEAQTLNTWIENNYPVHSDGGQSTYDIDGNPLVFNLTAPQITALENAIDSFTATITV